MPIISAMVGSPKRGADVVFGIVADPKDPFFSLDGMVKATLRIIQIVRAKARARTIVSGGT